MTRLSRRSLLGGAGICTGVSLAGCSALDLSEDAPHRARVVSVHVNIVHEQSHTVDLLILDDEEPIYMDSRTFEGAEDESDPYEVGGGTFDDLPEEAGEYAIWLQLDGKRWDTFDMSRDSLPVGWEGDEFPDEIHLGCSIGHEGREEGPPALSLFAYEANQKESMK